MNNNEFEAWLSQNVKNIGKGGSRPHIDPFNKAKKGSERNVRAEEYPMKDVDEFHHYPERYSRKKTDDDDNNDYDSSSQSRSNAQSQSQSQYGRQTSYSQSKASKASNSAGRVVQSVAKNVISKVALVVVGSVAVVTGYNEIQAHEAAKAAPVVTSVEWQWKDDYSSAFAELLDAKGALVKEVTATVTYSEVAPTCTAAGTITYTATYIGDDGKERSDVKTVTLDAVGHDFIKTGETTSGDTVTTTFECTHCHEQTTVTVSVTEEDGN